MEVEVLAVPLATDDRNEVIFCSIVRRSRH
jgi:hypothetical protein